METERDISGLERSVNSAMAGFACCLERLAKEVVTGPQQSKTERGTPYTTYGLGCIQVEGSYSYLMPVEGTDGEFLRKLQDNLDPMFEMLAGQLKERPRLVWRLKPIVYCRGPHTQEEIDTFQLKTIFTKPMFWARMRLAMETMTQ